MLPSVPPRGFLPWRGATLLALALLLATTARSARSQALPIAAGARVEGLLGQREIHAFALTVAPGQAAVLRLEGEPAALDLRILGPGDEVRSVPADPFCPRRVTLDEPGELVLELSTERRQASYRLELATTPAGSAASARVQAERQFETAVRASTQARQDPEVRATVLQEFEAVGKQWHEMGDRCLEAAATWYRGDFEPDNHQALPILQRALDLFAELDEPYGEGRARNSLAVTQLYLGEPEAAEELVTAALDDARRAGEPRLVVDALTTRASVLRSRGKDDAAIAAGRAAVAAAREAGFEEVVASNLSALAELYVDVGQPEEAVAATAEGLEIAARRGDLHRQAWLLRNLGRAHEALGQTDLARHDLERSVALRHRTGDRRGEAVARRDLAALLGRHGRAAEGLRQLEIGLGLVRAIGDRVGEAAVLDSQAELLLQLGRPRAARGLLAEVARFEAAGEFRGRAYLTGLHRAEASLAIGELERAGREISEAVTHAEEKRAGLRNARDRAGWFARWRRILVTQSAILLARERRQPGQGFAAAAFAASERAHARMLFDTVRETLPDAEPGLLDLAAVQARLGDGEVLLEYLVGRERTTLFVVDHTGLEVHELPEEQALGDLVREFRESLQDPGALGAGRRTMQARRLYRLLVAPARRQLETARRLVLVPDGPLLLLPFATLQIDAGGPGGSPEYLVGRWSLAAVPSMSVAAALNRRPRRPQAEPAIELYAVADPSAAEPPPELAQMRSPTRGEDGAAAGAALPRLQAAREEVRAIAALLPADAVVVRVGADAGEAVVRADPRLRAARRIHFATHALVNSIDPDRSALVLAGGDGEDGLLRVPEIASLELGADLVVLAGCDTGLGRQVRGEGLLGLTQAFLDAGARRLVVTLWQVPDRGTERLMTRFYRELRQTDPAEALARAQRKAIESGEAPFAWAPFVVVGG